MEIFEGQDIRVVARLFDKAPRVLVVTFTGRAANPPVEKGFGENYFFKRGISAVHFISKDNHWWQTPEPVLAIGKLRERGLIGRGQDITLYGSSMGGYASLILSKLINPRRIVVFSPQYSIDGKRVPFERRWRSYAARISFEHDDMAAGIDPAAEIKIVYDPFFLPDRQHVKLIEGHRNVEHVPVPFAGHNTARALEELGVITRVIDQLLFGDFQVRQFLHLYRQTRARSSLFWYGLSQALARHNHHAGAMLASYAAASILVSSGRMKDIALRRDILRSAIEMATAADMPEIAERWLASLKEIESSSQHLAPWEALIQRSYGNWSKVDQTVDRILNRGRNEPVETAIKIEALSKLKGPAAAFEYHQALPSALQRSPAVLLAYARARADNKDWAFALELLDRFFLHEPRNPVARTLGARCWMALDQPESAMKLLSPILKYRIASDSLLEEVALLMERGRGLRHADKLRTRHRRHKRQFHALKGALEKIDWFAPNAVGTGRWPDEWRDWLRESHATGHLHRLLELSSTSCYFVATEARHVRIPPNVENNSLTATRAIMTDLYIHIGAPKTGTTAIQHHLLTNRGSLARDHGVLYPSGGLLGAGHHVIGAAVFPERSHRLQGVSREDALSRSIENVRKEMETLAPHTVILSTEYLWGELSPENVNSLLQPFSHCRIKIVAYLRRQDLLAQSLYVQAIKGGLADPFPVWLERVAGSGRAGFDFYKVLSAWTRSGVPTEIVVRVYEKSQLKNDICSDFLATVCPGGVSLPTGKAKVVNPGPDRATVELLRLVSGKITDRMLAASIRKRILTHSPSRPLFAPLDYLSASEADAFMARFAEANANVARNFLQREDGRLFEAIRPIEASVPKEHIQSEDILRRFIDLLPVLLTGADVAPSKASSSKKVKRPPANKRPRHETGIGSL